MSASYRTLSRANNSRISVATQTGGFVYGFGITNGESFSLASSQAAVYRSTDTMDFAPYSCFGALSSTVATIVSITQ